MNTRVAGRSPGQSLIEFALILSVLLMLFLGLFDLGRVFNTYIVLTNAAREGARYGTMHPDEYSAIVNRVIREADNSGVTLTADRVTVTTTGVPGSPVVVTVQHDFSLLSSWLVGRRTLRLQGRAEMVVL
jgi:Flp pilus assembly protein TadG